MAFSGILPLSSFGVGSGVADITSTTSATGKSTSSGSGFFSGLGDVLGGALSTGANFLSGLATIDLFKRAQGAGIPGTITTTGATNTGSQQSGTTSATAGGMGLPSWAVPAGIGVVALLLIVLMLRG